MKSIDETILDKLTRISKVLTNISVFSNSKVVRTAAVDYEKYSGMLADKIVSFYEKVKSSNIDYTADKNKKEDLVNNFNKWVDETYADFRKADPEFNNTEMRPKLESALKSKSAEAYDLYNTLVTAPENPVETEQLSDAGEVAQEKPQVDLELDKVFSKFLAKYYANVRYSSVEAKKQAEAELKAKYAALSKESALQLQSVLKSAAKSFPPRKNADTKIPVLNKKVFGIKGLGHMFDLFIPEIQAKIASGRNDFLNENTQEFISDLVAATEIKSLLNFDYPEYAKHCKQEVITYFKGYTKPEGSTLDAQQQMQKDIYETIQSHDILPTLQDSGYNELVAFRNKINTELHELLTDAAPVITKYYNESEKGLKRYLKSVEDTRAYTTSYGKFMRLLADSIAKIFPVVDKGNMDAFFGNNEVSTVKSLLSGKVAIASADITTIINAVNTKYRSMFNNFVEENDGTYTLDEIVSAMVPAKNSRLKSKIYSYLDAQVITAEEEYTEEYSDEDIKEYTEDYLEDTKESIEQVADFVSLMDTVTKEMLSNNFLTEEQLKELGDSVGKQVSTKKDLEDKVVASVNNVLNNVFSEISIEEFREAVKDVSFAAEFSKAIHSAVTGVSKRFSAPKISIKPDGTIDLNYDDSGVVGEEPDLGEGAGTGESESEQLFPTNDKGIPASEFAPSELEERTGTPDSEMGAEEKAGPTKEEMAGGTEQSGDAVNTDEPVPVEEPTGEMSKVEKTFNKYNK